MREQIRAPDEEAEKSTTASVLDAQVEIKVEEYECEEGVFGFGDTSKKESWCSEQCPFQVSEVEGGDHEEINQDIFVKEETNFSGESGTFNPLTLVSAELSNEESGPSDLCAVNVLCQSRTESVTSPSIGSNDASPITSTSSPKCMTMKSNCGDDVLPQVNKSTPEENNQLQTFHTSGDKNISDSDSVKVNRNKEARKKWNRKKPKRNEGGVASLVQQKPKKKRRMIYVECEVCGKTYEKRHLKEHLLIHSSERNFQCDICLKSFKLPKTLKLHMRIHNTESRQFVCSFCQKSYASQAYLRLHEKRHSQEPVFTCRFCNKGFYERFNLQIHENEHTNEKIYECEICGAQFIAYMAFHSHKRKHNPIMYNCEVCSQSYSEKRHLHRHMKSHNPLVSVPKPNYVCDSCGKTFGSREYFKDHLRIHTGEKPFVCEVCGKRSRTHVLHTQHSIIHTGEKPYVCSVCNKGFTQRTTLVIHKRSHTGEKPYTCSVCFKSYSSNSALSVHKKRHTIVYSSPRSLYP